MYGTHRTYAGTAPLSRGTSHVTTKQHSEYITLVDIQHALLKGYSHSFRITVTGQDGTASLPESREQRYIQAIKRMHLNSSCLILVNSWLAETFWISLPPPAKSSTPFRRLHYHYPPPCLGLLPIRAKLCQAGNWSLSVEPSTGACGDSPRLFLYAKVR